MFEVNVNIDFEQVSTVLKNHGLNNGGKIQTFFTNEVMRRSDKYTPMQSGMLKNNTTILSSKDGFIYNSPYARYHWYGKKMVGPAPKTLTNEDMTYHGAPLRGPFWVNRMWVNEGDKIIDSVQKMVDRGGN